MSPARALTRPQPIVATKLKCPGGGQSRSVSRSPAPGWSRARRPVLLPFDEGQPPPQPLVLDDRGLAPPLLLVERPVGQGQAPPAQLEPAVREGVGVHVPPREPGGRVV